MANYNLTQTGDEVQAYIDSIPVIDVTGMLSGSNIVFATNPYTQIAANYAADCSSIVRLTVGTAVYLLRVTQYDGTNYTAAEMTGAHNVVATIGSSAASAVINSGVSSSVNPGSEDIVTASAVADYVREKSEIITLVGSGNTYVTNSFSGVLAGHTYRINVKYPNIDMTGVTSGTSSFRFGVKIYDGTTEIGYPIFRYIGSTLLSEYYFKVPSTVASPSIIIGMRAAVSAEQVFLLEDVTENYSDIAERLSNGLAVKLDLGGIVAYGEYDYSMVNRTFSDVHSKRGTARTSLATRTATNHVMYKIPLAGVEWMDIYQTNFTQVTGSVIVDSSDVVRIGIDAKSGAQAGQMIIPNDGEFLYYDTSFSLAKITLHPFNETKDVVEHNDAKTNGGEKVFSADIDMLKFGGRGSDYMPNAVGGNFFASLDVQYNNTNFYAMAIDVEGYTNIEFDSFISSTYGSFVCSADGTILQRIPNTTAINRISSILAAGAKWFIYIAYINITPYVKLTSVSPYTNISDVANIVSPIATITNPNVPTNMQRVELTLTTGYYMNTDGTTGTASNGWYSQKISVGYGDIVYLCNNYQDVILKRILTAFDAGGNAISAQGQSTGHYFYRVPSENVTDVVISYIGPSVTSPYALVAKANIIDFAKQNSNLLGSQNKTAASLADGEVLEMRPYSIVTGNRLAFSCNLTTMGTLYLGGVLANGNFVPNLIITSDMLTWHNGDTADLTQAHGLTIADDLQVVIIQKELTAESLFSMDIIVTSQGNTYKWSGNFRALFGNRQFGVKMSGATIMDVSFGMSSTALKSPVWYFGDSYITFGTARWPYYYVQDFGYNLMLAGYAGAPTTDMFMRLQNLLAEHRPQYIIWGMGMNDSDDSSSVNWDWDRVTIGQLVPLCAALGIELILCTIPTTPSRQNNYKNAIVRASGLRYVDFDIAVRPDQSVRTWITGALSSDNVHPTAQGAKILYHRLISDAPEVMML